MRRLPGILLLTVATLTVIVALLVSGLRLVLPQLNTWRPQLLTKISTLSGMPVNASYLTGRWENFGPVVDIRDVTVALEDGGQLAAKRVTLALDVWQSLLHMRWQFRDLTFWQLNAQTNTPLQVNHDGESLTADSMSDLFLRQFNYFTLRDSHLSFLTLSGQRADLSIPQLSWLNSGNRHRAEGELSLSSLNGQHGVMQVRMDLQDDNGLLNKGRIWLQANDIDVKPWLNRWTQDNIALQNAHFSLESWITVDKGDIASGDILLKRGGASWQGDNQLHQLTVDNLLAHILRVGTGWEVRIPDTRMAIDNNRWPQGALTMAWLPAADTGDELRIRASNLELKGLASLQSITDKLDPQLSTIWRTTQPTGTLELLALDIPMQAMDKLRFQLRWHDLAWQQWQLLPGAEHFSGEAVGSLANGAVHVSMHEAKMPYATVFRAPLEIAQGEATLQWLKNEQGWELDGRDIDIQATGVRAHGGFRYLQPQDDAPWLGILAGISTNDGGQAWRYFPENLMGKDLVDYLSGAIKGGQATDATLVYRGNPQQFPYLHNEGQFEVSVPLSDATFAFQPDWPALSGLNMHLDFVNNGLWMSADKVMLGKVSASSLNARIPDYAAEKLLIDADIAGPGREVGSYFQQTPLKSSLGAALNELQLEGDVNARLHLDIPLDGKLTTASGEVRLANNSLFIKPIDTTLKNLTGKFSFTNGDLQSETMSASWFNQPLSIDFSTTEGDKSFQVAVAMNADWQLPQLDLLPKAVKPHLRGHIPWEGKVAIELPYHGPATYKVAIDGDLKNVSSHLPAPLEKKTGQPLPVNINVTGGMKEFALTAAMGEKSRFNSLWLLKHKLTLERAALTSESKKLPALPTHSGIELNMPPLDATPWLALLANGAESHAGYTMLFPEHITLRTPTLTLAGQRWHDLRLVGRTEARETHVEAEARELKATLTMRKNAPWLAAIRYLYYNPATTPKSHVNSPTDDRIDFRSWPDLQLRCAECWLWGQKYGRIEGDFAIKGDTLTLSNGLVDTGFGRLNADGEWVNAPGRESTALKGKVYGNRTDALANFFSLASPVKGAPFDIRYDLRWRAPPWRPDIRTLNGILQSKLGKGEFTEISSGHAGQLLRLLSVDALLRKLRFDFSDTFSEGFYFDSIHSTASIKDGVLSTSDTLVDGLEADIAMKGSVDLVRSQLDLEAVVAPEISATVGVATAFVINPIVGAAVFAASKVLGPLWHKVSILRYHITGPLDRPQINEVLRQSRSTS